MKGLVINESGKGGCSKRCKDMWILVLKNSFWLWICVYLLFKKMNNGILLFFLKFNYWKYEVN